MRYRRKVVCGEDVTGFDDRDPLVVQDYIARLDAEGLVDFEGIIAAALEMIRTYPLVCDYLSARFPWLLVDEYQDLGGPLHQIVLSLIQQAGIKAFAVGDPDQTVYDFTGADPKYLNELVARPDFEAIRLRFNYRSGRRLIVASEVALAPSEPRNYQPAPNRKDLGEVYFEEAENGYEGQAAHIAQELIPVLDRQGIPRDEVAILYRSKGKLFKALARELTDAGIQYVAERDGLYPRSPFVKWLQSCAAWAISDLSNADVTFDEVLGSFVSFRRAAGLEYLDGGSLESRRTLYSVLTGIPDRSMPIAEWLDKFERGIKLSELLTLAGDQPDAIEDFDTLFAQASSGGAIEAYTVGDFANEGRIAGKITVTTLHSSKGRQFDAVIMPGLQESVIPRMDWNRSQRKYVDPAVSRMREDRRLFYVGFTRARKSVFLVFSPSFVNDYGYQVNLGESRFVTEIRRRLGELPTENTSAE
jgi:DNA helicase-2/ATP-dependent DNA helicase PcrA